MNARKVVDVVIVGAGGFGREVQQWAQAVQAAQSAPSAHVAASVAANGRPALNVLGFVDDDPAKQGLQLRQHRVLGDLAWLKAQSARQPGLGVLLAVGSPVAKQRLVAQLDGLGLQWPVLVHPTAILGDGVTLGRGTIICPRATLTVDVTLGAFCTVNLHCTLGHDARLGDYVTLAPGALISGFAQLHEGCELGTGAVVLPSAQVGAWAVVGASATVVKDLPARCTAVGTPARPLAR